MNFRSRFSHELRKLQKSIKESDSFIEEMKNHINEITLGLRDAKFHIDQAGIVIMS